MTLFGKGVEPSDHREPKVSKYTVGQVGTLFYTPKVAYVSESLAANSRFLVHGGHLALNLSLGLYRPLSSLDGTVAAYSISFDR